MYADDGQPLYFIAHIKDISARKRDEEMLRTAATRDTLTGVLNRGRFEEELARHGPGPPSRILRRCGRADDRPRRTEKGQRSTRPRPVTNT